MRTLLLKRFIVILSWLSGLFLLLLRLLRTFPSAQSYFYLLYCSYCYHGFSNPLWFSYTALRSYHMSYDYYYYFRSEPYAQIL